MSLLPSHDTRRQTERIDENHVRDVCKVGQGKECCRYLTRGLNGWSCEKLTHAAYFDKRVAEGNMFAQGDNCPGRASV